MKFDEDYYKNIWGGVHRHDYCESLADSLISKYGKVRFLDIGTGCGELVRILNEKGASAYGLEISEYAVANSHGNVILGSVTDIPFRDNSFDVIFSQGLWEYIGEKDIERAWLECNRVGRIQRHNIDTISDNSDWSKDFATHKSQEWWDEKLKMPKILVACPCSEPKEYSLQRWIDNVKSLTYPNLDIMVVDSWYKDDQFINRWKDQVTMKYINGRDIENLLVLRLNLAYEFIRKEFLAGNYERLMIIESDVIPPQDVIEQLNKWGQGADWISHAYPTRDGNPDEDAIQGIGCSLFTRRLIEKYDFISLGDNYMSDGGLWMKVRSDRSMKTVELWNIFKNQHLKE